MASAVCSASSLSASTLASSASTSAARRLASAAALADNVHGVGRGGKAGGGALDPLRPLEIVGCDRLESHGRQDDVRDKVLGAHLHVRALSLESHGKALAQSLDRIGVVQLVTLHGMALALGRVEGQHSAAVDIDAVALLRQTPLERGPCPAPLQSRLDIVVHRIGPEFLAAVPGAALGVRHMTARRARLLQDDLAPAVGARRACVPGTVLVPRELEVVEGGVAVVAADSLQLHRVGLHVIVVEVYLPPVNGVDGVDDDMCMRNAVIYMSLDHPLISAVALAHPIACQCVYRLGIQAVLGIG